MAPYLGDNTPTQAMIPVSVGLSAFFGTFLFFSFGGHYFLVFDSAHG
ncbi:hypothetical protein [Paenibacillus stellifer]|nr:hypothetical protein [Paenibacillus stellifer]